MDSKTPDFDLLSEFIDKNVIVSVTKGAYNSSTSLSGGSHYFKGKLLKINSKFILLMVKNKKILINIDQIVTIEEC